MLPQLEVVAARLDLCPQELAAAAERLCASERARATRLRFERDRRRYVAARGRLRELIAERLAVAPESIQFTYGHGGKPALAGGLARSGWRFSVSRCEDAALYAFSRAGEVGVDLEALRALPEAGAIAARFFSPAENAALGATAPHQRAAAFLRCWTRKEALAKALGEGLCTDLPALDASADEARGWRLESFAPLPGFVAAVAFPCA